MPTECVIGVDLGGTNLKAAVVDRALAVHASSERVITGLALDELLDAVAETVGELREAADAEVEAVGFGVACLFDESGVGVSSTHLPIAGVPVAAVLSERIGLPVFADNDANVALLSEARAGAAQGAHVALLVALGTGVGGAIAFDGEIYHGAHGIAAEVGHIVLSRDGPACGPGCRSRGCLEALVSGTALARDAAAAGLAADGPRVTELARAGDPTALRLLDELGEWLGIGLVSLANVIGPDVIVIGGGVSGAGELILEPAGRVLRERAPLAIAERVEVRLARFGAHAGMLGAAVLAREALPARSRVGL